MVPRAGSRLHTHATEQVSGHSERVARAPKGRTISCREEIKNEFVTCEQRQSGNVRQEAEKPQC